GSMRKGVFLPFALLCGALVWCARDKSPLGPVEGPAVCPQHEVPWPSLANSPWPMYRHDPQLTGRSPYRGPRKGRVKWKFQPAEKGLIYPAVVIGPDSTIYFGYMDLGPQDQPTLLCALKPDGTLRWRCRLGGGTLRSEPGPPFVMANGEILVQHYAEDRAYVVSQEGSIVRALRVPSRSIVNVGPDGTLYYVGNDRRLYALSQEGTIRWQREIEGGFHWTGPAISPDGSVVYVLTGMPPLSSHLKAVSAVGAIDGSIRWEFPIPEGMHSSIAPVVSSEGKVFIGVFGSWYLPGLYCIGPGGESLWSYGPGLDGGKEPTIHWGGQVVFEMTTEAEGGGVIWADCAGVPVWRVVPTTVTYAGPICDADGVTYVFGREVLALDRRGKPIWEVPLEGSFTRIAAPAIGSDGVLYLGTFGTPSLLYAIE
ncbi:MAG: PQQ-binding-like beta-propeller repeat protein, partial [candidate division KSB1 bacterium]|nr:PQQ-binding-like beta-propeller repeat protein [candidate division KSB1 bacterium]